MDTNHVFPDMIDTLFINCHICTMADGQLSVIQNGALAVTGNIISWVGKRKDLPENCHASLKKSGQVINVNNCWILPGFVDCHTHLIWAGHRANEFEQRLAGMTYEQIAMKGGGILSTVRATRMASLNQLFDLSAKRLKILMQQGITTVEIKSGYGLNLDDELKILEVSRKLDQAFPVHIESTFLGAHTLPPEYKNDSDGYVDFIVYTMLQAVKYQGIATAVDVFCEKIGFTPDQTKQILSSAVDLGFNIKLHAEQLSNLEGAGLAAALGALSCDHLEYLSSDSARAMAKNNVTAVLLPGAFYYLNETRKPPVSLLRKLGIPMAVATDLNPGTSPVFSMLSIMNMACNLFGLTCEESLLGATLYGAKALGMESKKGSLEVGKDADLAIWDIANPIDLCYFTGISPLNELIIKGEAIPLS